MQKDRFAEKPKEIQISENQERVLLLRPLGPQGPKLSVGISGEEDFRRLDEAMGKLSESERKTFEGMRKAVADANLSVVDS